MISMLTRLGRIVTWLLVSLLVLLAIAITALRVLLPEMNRFKDEIQGWVSAQSHIQFEISDVRGFWRNTHPSLALQGVQARFPDGSQIQFNTDRIDVEFDLFDSLLQQEPVVANLVIHQLRLDIRSVDLNQLNPSSGDEALPGAQGRVLRRLDDLFLRQLDDFSLQNSTIQYQSLAGDMRQLDIDKLHWKNQGQRHLAEGVVSLADAEINSLKVSADFRDHGSLSDISGDFYVSADKLRVLPWLTRYLKDATGIQRGVVSFDGWMTLENNQPVDGYVALKPSELIWQQAPAESEAEQDAELSSGSEQATDSQRHELLLESGILVLSPHKDGWKVSAHSLKARTDDTPWPELDFALDWQPQQWRLNASQLDIAALLPLARLVPESQQTNQLLDELSPSGLVENLRVQQGVTPESLRYSATLQDIGIKQWELLPEVHNLQAKVSGTPDKAVIHASLIDDVLPYGEVFQAPLNIRQGQVDMVWQRDDSGWSLWADKVTAATPDLQVLGAFRLDFPEDKSPFLSFYAEADLHNAGETWRYLPTLALGHELTDYLSTAIQGGKVNTAKLLWYGELGDFPYSNHNGMFQAWVGLKQATFSFDTAWPAITDMQLDLLFENDAMYLDSHAATLKEVKAQRITGRIPHLESDGHIEIEASAVAQGNTVRDYMTATPLVDSVGAALTAIQVSGDVTSEFQLNIPFSSKQEPRAWGWVDLDKNHVEIDAPPMTLEAVSGRIEFDNDVVTAAGLSASLLEQPISFDFRGESAAQGYAVNIDLVGDWELKPLAPYVGARWLNPLQGHAPWQMGVDIQLNDVGFTYQIDARANLNRVASRYPYPLNKPVNSKGTALLQASGNQQSISARVQVPNAKYQAEIDITKSVPVLTATNLVVGQGSFRISPVVGHDAQIRTDKLDLDQWISLLQPEPQSKSTSALATVNTPQIPTPQRVDVRVKELHVADLDWHDVVFNARQKDQLWQMTIDSQEAQGVADYQLPDKLSVNLQRLHLYIPQLDEQDGKAPLVDIEKQDAPLISDFDRQFHALMPDLKLDISDFWLQGYKVGKLAMAMERQHNTLNWKQIDLTSGTNEVHINGGWTLHNDRSHTTMNLAMKGDNNSDLMERFGISSGIQKAPFDMTSQLQWDGAPWSMKVNTLQGKLETELGKGVISNVSGAARLLGLFSLDSIIRKMQLDFSDVFDDGMVFNSITGNGEISQGVFVTNNIKMDAVAGEMTIKGLADLNTRTVDAEVNFVPDLTSGIPVLSAFAVTPATALYVLAVNTLISPVVEIFTQVNYEVKGPLDAPTVKELSRTRGEFKLPEKLRKLAE
ncbi:YhdP family protein [Vibrio sp. ABG19]|uniref:YhdP family protein n=1 Tax=Vibrio sp. ABG19 TaxID=2817385 RepID=UPI00249E4E6F|nr:YhdP family protein [Vibrio sp. ABG19]WGY48585.1 TIGR02099 family protein [Vibrio sp. ABG19]